MHVGGRRTNVGGKIAHFGWRTIMHFGWRKIMHFGWRKIEPKNLPAEKK